MKLPYQKRKALYGYGFIALWLVGTVIWFLYPLAESLRYSFMTVKPEKGGDAKTGPDGAPGGEMPPEPLEEAPTEPAEETPSEPLEEVPPEPEKGDETESEAPMSEIPISETPHEEE